MVDCIIIDDELKSRESLNILINDFCEDVTVMALCKNVNEGLDAIREHKPQIVFLDIQMQKETGFDLLASLDKIDFEVIFTTAYSEYAIKAFRFNAIDYLLKPIDISELKAAIEKVINKKNDDIALRLEQLMQSLIPSQNQISKIALPTSSGLVFININDILYCEASSNYTKFYTNDGKNYLVTRTLKEYDKMLTEYNFYRIHNSYLINLNSIKQYVRGDGGYVIMNNDTTIDVSKRKKVSFLKKLGYT